MNVTADGSVALPLDMDCDSRVDLRWSLIVTHSDSQLRPVVYACLLGHWTSVQIMRLEATGSVLQI